MKHVRAIAISFLSLTLLLPGFAIAAANDDPANNPLTCAHQIAVRMKSDHEMNADRSLRDIALVYMALRRLDQFLEVYKQIGCDEQFYSSKYFADEAIKAGSNEYAVKIIDQAFLCAKDEDPGQKGPGFVWFVEKLLKLDQFDLAKVIAESIDDETSDKAIAFSTLADEYARQGRNDQSLLYLDRAFTQAKTANEEMADNTLEALGIIAAGYTKLNMRDKALQSLEFASELAEKQKDFYKPRDKGEVAVAYARAGFDEQALLLTKSISDDQKLVVLTAISSLFIERGQTSTALRLISEAKRLINTLEYAYNRSLEYEKLVELYLQANMPEQALEIASEITDDYCYTQAAVKIADWASKRKRSDLAISALDNASRKAKLIVSEKPSEITGEMSSSRAKSKAGDLSQIAYRYIEAKQFDRAQASIEAIDLPQVKAEKLADLAIGMANASLQDKAIDVLNKARLISQTSKEYPHDTTKDRSLANIACGYASAGNKKEATRLFAEALKFVSKLESYDDRSARLNIIALNFEQSGIETDGRIRKVLKKILKDWDDD